MLERTLYMLASSREQLVRAAVVEFFRTATARVEATLAGAGDPTERLVVYLHAVATALAPASVQFFDDVAAFGSAAEVYEQNTRAAAGGVEQPVREGVASEAFRAVDTTFAADVVTSLMVRIQQRQVAAATGLDDAAAYQQLSSLLLRGLADDDAASP